MRGVNAQQSHRVILYGFLAGCRICSVNWQGATETLNDPNVIERQGGVQGLYPAAKVDAREECEAGNGVR